MNTVQSQAMALTGSTVIDVVDVMSLAPAGSFRLPISNSSCSPCLRKIPPMAMSSSSLWKSFRTGSMFQVPG